MKHFTKAELATQTPGECLIAIRGFVYNVAPFFGDHPGGADILRSSRGKDVTRDFDDVGHTSEAQKKMEGFLIGTISMERQEMPGVSHRPTATSNMKVRTEKGSKRKEALIALGIFLFFGVLLVLRLSGVL
jgi:cytochrome b involved in lipid metabolism